SEAGKSDDSGGGGGEQGRTPVSAGSRDRQADLRGGGASGAAERGAAGADVATVTPELEKACKELMYGVQLGGPYLPPAYMRLRVQFPGNHGGVNWFGTSFNPELGYLFVNTNEMGQLSGLRDHDPKTGPARAQGVGNRLLADGPYEGVPGGGRFSIPGQNGDPQQLMCQ